MCHDQLAAFTFLTDELRSTALASKRYAWFGFWILQSKYYFETTSKQKKIPQDVKQST